MKLLLTSQGLYNHIIKEAFLNLLPKKPEDISVAFITTAAYGEDDNPTWLEEYRNELKSCGITQIEDLDLKDKAKENLENILQDKDIIFVNGGNTFYLLKHARESGFAELLKPLLKKGKIYVGISAGSILVGPSIELCIWEKGYDRNNVKLTDLTGLNIIPFAIFPHAQDTEKDRLPLQPFIRSVSYPVYPLTDEQAILVENGDYKIIGSDL